MNSSRARCASLLSLLLALPAGPGTAAVGQGDILLEQIGGRGGTYFQVRCPAGLLLIGFNLRAGENIDALQPVCAPAYEPARVDYQAMARAMPTLGGSGGQPAGAICPRATPVVVGIWARSEGFGNEVLNNIHLYCGVVAAQQTVSKYPSARFDAPHQQPRSSNGLDSGGGPVPDFSALTTCPSGLVAVGVFGRAGKMIDAVGLICGAPHITFRRKGIGTVRPPDDPKTAATTDGTLGVGRRAGGQHAGVRYEDVRLPVAGGDGGREFAERCPAQSVMVGVRFRSGLNIDAVQPLCLAATDRGVQPGVWAATRMAGGTGGELGEISCPARVPIVRGIYVSAAQDQGLLVVTGIALHCGVIEQGNVPEQRAAAISARSTPAVSEVDRSCPDGLVGVGIYGRTGGMVDALGLICGR